MSQFFFTPLSFQDARNRYRDRLQEMDKIVFPDKKHSLLDNGMSPEEADKAVVDALESRLHQGTVLGNLMFFAGTFSGGELNLDGKAIEEMILSIAENRKLLKDGIRNRFSGEAVHVMTGFFAGLGAGFLIGRFSALAAQAPISAKALNTLSGALRTLFLSGKASGTVLKRLEAVVSQPDTPISGNGGDNTQFLMVGVIVALAVIAGVVFASKKAGKRPRVLIEDKIPDKQQALEVLTLAECLADIYRDERT